MAYRILSLDGGGAWALVEVKALIALFGADVTGHEVLRKFDAVAANSGGAIVLAGLLENLSLGALLDLFMAAGNRRSIFSPTDSVGSRIVNRAFGVGPKYAAARKLPALRALLPQAGDKAVLGITAGLAGPGGADVAVAIAAFDYDVNRAVFFRAVPMPAPGIGVACPGQTTLAEAVHASSNAPVNYFDAPACVVADRYWDGAVGGFNNPVLAAVTDALASGVAAADMCVLSIGTGTVRLPPGGKGARTSAFLTPWQESDLLNDVTKMGTAILDDPPDSASFMAHIVLGERGLPRDAVSRVVRVSPLIAPVKGAAPAGMSVAAFSYLCGIGLDAVADKQVAAIAGYADAWLAGSAPNEMIHDNLAGVEIGYATFGAAVRAWAALTGG